MLQNLYDNEMYLWNEAERRFACLYVCVCVCVYGGCALQSESEIFEHVYRVVTRLIATMLSAEHPVEK